MNLYALPSPLPPEEEVQVLLGKPGGTRIERILSNGHSTPAGAWYDQDQDEWVMVLEGEAELEYADGRRLHLGRGDQVFLPRHVRHRVAQTSRPCLWLAVHGDLTAQGDLEAFLEGRDAEQGDPRTLP